MSSSKQLKCRVEYTSGYNRENGIEPEVYEYQLEVEPDNIKLITMVGCGALFLEGLTFDGDDTELVFAIKDGRKWKLIAHFTTEE
jgi:hypothetical protein